MQTTTPRRSLEQLLPLFAADPRVKGVHLCGSMSRGKDDEVSDVDLWIQAENWTPEPLYGRLVALQQISLHGRAYANGVDADGTILDLFHGPDVPGWYVPVHLPPPPDTPQTSAKAPDPFGLAEEFWLNTLKHRKSLWRGEYGVVSFGLQIDRRFLLRAWALANGDPDPGDGAFNVYSLRELTEKFLNPDRLALLGLPLRDPAEIEAAVLAYRDEITRLFPTPSPLETVVRRLPFNPPTET